MHRVVVLLLHFFLVRSYIKHDRFLARYVVKREMPVPRNYFHHPWFVHFCLCVCACVYYKSIYTGDPFPLPQPAPDPSYFTQLIERPGLENPEQRNISF